MDNSRNPDESQIGILRITNQLLVSLNVAAMLFLILIKFRSFADAVIAAVLVFFSLLFFLFPRIKRIHDNEWFSSWWVSIILIAILLFVSYFIFQSSYSSETDLSIASINNRDDSKVCGTHCTITIEGNGISSLQPGDKLSVYGPQTRVGDRLWAEAPIAVLGTVQVNEDIAIAQVLLMHELALESDIWQIASNLRIKKTTELDDNYLLPVFGDGYLLSEDTVRLREAHSVQENDIMVNLEPRLQGDRIVDHLVGDTRLKVTEIGREGFVARIELISGSLPPNGSIVQLEYFGESDIEEPEMIFISGSTFQLGSSTGDLDETPFVNIEIDDFFISKNEVTNFLFRQFVNDDGYENPEYWTEEGNLWKNQKGAIEPRYWQNPLYNQPLQPVVGITWYEATAFANWLSEKTHHRYYIPSEMEWELACKGQGRLYPWGEYWKGEFTNSADFAYKEDYPNHSWADSSVNDRFTYPAPVGSFIAGATPEGVNDLAGNVWEWTSSNYKSYSEIYDIDRIIDNDEHERTTRGGGWGSTENHLRCSNRSSQTPSYSEYNLGIRLARRP